MKFKKILLCFVFLAIVVLLVFSIKDVLTIEYLKTHRAELQSYISIHFLWSSLCFFILYLVVTMFSIPGATILTLAAGALFGLVWGVILVSFASSIGATLAMLLARYVFREVVKEKFHSTYEIVDKKMKENGKRYLFALRLTPAFPFFLVNLVMGLTAINWITFYWVSQLGMLIATILYVNAGTQIAQIDSFNSILSTPVLLSFFLLAIFPFVINQITKSLKLKKLYSNYSKPKNFDYNLVVIGAGAGGLVTSYIAAAVKAKVLLIEKSKMGGDCLNYGCVPSKALIKSAKVAHKIRNANHYGLVSNDQDFNFTTVMERVNSIIKEVSPHDSIDRYTNLGVECLIGNAYITSPWEIVVDGKRITTKNIVLATGAEPFIPPIKGLNEVPFYTSDTIWSLKERPRKLLVLGGGPIGCELAQAFARLGSEVIQVDRSSQILQKEDPEVSELILNSFKDENIIFLGDYNPLEFVRNANQYILVAEHNGEKVNIEFDAVLLAVGRKARLEGYGLRELGLIAPESKTIEVNEYLETKYPNIFACGDLIGPYQFTHFAAYQAWFCAVNSLFRIFKKFKVDYRVIPRCTYTDPEVASVGLNEKEANSKGIKYDVYKYPMHELDRAITESETKGFIKVLTVPGKDKILGVTIVGTNAGEYLSEYTLAMKYKLGLNKILSTVHPYPTFSEANKYVAGVWKNKNKPERLLSYINKFHQFMRGR